MNSFSQRCTGSAKRPLEAKGNTAAPLQRCSSSHQSPAADTSRLQASASVVSNSFCSSPLHLHRVLENEPSSSVSPAAVGVCDCVVCPGQRLVSSPLKRTRYLFCFYFCHFSSKQREKSLCVLNSWWDKRRRCEDVTSGFGDL